MRPDPCVFATALFFPGVGVVTHSAETPPAPAAAAPEIKMVRLPDVRMRDACILPDPATKTYTIVSSARRGVRAYTSKDLINWEGPHMTFQIPDGFWEGANIRSIWAPELHAYTGKYYLFLTFDTADKFPEQWRNGLPRVKRGSQVLVSDSPLAPFKPSADRSTLPPDMMTLDGTLWVEDGVPYMIVCHEWVQIVNGAMEMIRLTDDLSATVGEPTRLFFGNDAPWSSGGAEGHTVGVAVSDSGKLAGPWVQRAEPLFEDDGGHSMIFRTFEGQVMMVLPRPNRTPDERAHIYEIEDTGETLRVVREFGAP